MQSKTKVEQEGYENKGPDYVSKLTLKADQGLTSLRKYK